MSSPNTITANSARVHANGDKTDVGANPIYSAVNGEQMMILFKILSTAIDAKMNVTPGLNAAVVEAMKPLILSSTVKTSP